MSYQEILKELRNKQYRPVYFLHGNEAYYIDLIAQYIEDNVLTEAEKSFNLTIVYGKEADPKSLIDMAYRYPMMSPYQIVVLREAQEMKSLAGLKLYIENPVPTTLLVICHKHKKFDMRTSFAKALKSKALVFESKKLYDNQVAAWIDQYLKSKKLKIRSDASELIAEHLGTNLAKVSNELDKLALNIPGGSTVTTQHVQDHVGISKDYNIFELQKALAFKNIPKANRIVQYFVANPRKNPMVLIIGALYNFFSKVYMLHFIKNNSEQEMLTVLKLRSAFFLKEYKSAVKHYDLREAKNILRLLQEYDLKSKGVHCNTVHTSEGELLKELVFRIMH